MNTYEITIPDTQDLMRLDIALAAHCPNLSRSQIQKHITDGQVLVNETVIRTKKHPLRTNDVVKLAYTPQTKTHDAPQSMDIDIVYEDGDLLVINKPAGLIVHPGAGAPDQTLLNAIIARHPDNQTLPQAGLIHRLDKDTTGLLLIAKNESAYKTLNEAMANRHIKRHYLALVNGIVHTSGTIDEPLARHPKHRTKFCVHPTGRRAVTHYQVHERLKHHTLLKVELETGRTHQIRVHMHYIRHPIVGDLTYHKGHSPKKNLLPEAALNALYHFKRQALHAYELSFQHPTTKKTIHLTCPLPKDFSDLLEMIKS